MRAGLDTSSGTAFPPGVDYVARVKYNETSRALRVVLTDDRTVGAADKGPTIEARLPGSYTREEAERLYSYCEEVSFDDLRAELEDIAAELGTHQPSSGDAEKPIGARLLATGGVLLTAAGGGLIPLVVAIGGVERANQSEGSSILSALNPAENARRVWARVQQGAGAMHGLGPAMRAFEDRLSRVARGSETA